MVPYTLRPSQAGTGQIQLPTGQDFTESYETGASYFKLRRELLFCSGQKLIVNSGAQINLLFNSRQRSCKRRRLNSKLKKPPSH